MLQRVQRGRGRGHRHVGLLDAGLAEAEQLDLDAGVGDTSRAISRVVTIAPALPSAGWVWAPKVMVPPGAPASAWPALGGGREDALVAPTARRLLAEARVEDRRVDHVAALEGAVVGQRGLVLLEAVPASVRAASPA
jgi:hypothetical protein